MRNDCAAPLRCDIFCTVVDNYGDIGVCWRLARQLTHEHGAAVRLWVDNLASFRRLCPEVDVQLVQQHCRGVEIRHWEVQFPEVETAELVIEAFACKLPESYVLAMAAQQPKPVWINLEYLSAEDWVEDCHKLPSPHPFLPLVKYFFFPGFTPKTGGLLLEHGLLAQRDNFMQDAVQQHAFWQALGLELPEANSLKVSLFGYKNTALHGLFDTWAQGTQAVLCLVPEALIQPQVEHYFEERQKFGIRNYMRGNLHVRVLPFVEQENYDQLLWACDINFVRGEDSFVRAQWAGKPFIWQIYPQHDGVHLQKMRAFLKLYCAVLPSDEALALHRLWEVWNGVQAHPQILGEADCTGQVTSTSSGHAWNDFHEHGAGLRQHALDWAQTLSVNNLALNLLDYFHQIDIMTDC